MKTALSNPSAPPTAPEMSRQVMTYGSTVAKTAAMFAVLLASAGVVWSIGPTFWFPAAIGGSIAALILGIIIAMKKKPSGILTILFTIAEGVLVGGFSAALESRFHGIVGYAVLATLCTFAAMLVLFSTGVVRASKKLTKIVMIAMVGYGLFSLVNFLLVLTGVMDGYGLRDVTVFGIPLGIPLGILAVLMAAYCLVMDFDMIQNGVRNRMPEKYEWLGVYGLISTIVWMYIEFLRLFSFFYRSN